MSRRKSEIWKYRSIESGTCPNCGRVEVLAIVHCILQGTAEKGKRAARAFRSGRKLAPFDAGNWENGLASGMLRHRWNTHWIYASSDLDDWARRSQPNYSAFTTAWTRSS